MKKNDFPTNPVAFSQYVWENIEEGDTLIDKFYNIWEVSSYVVFDGRRITINIRCIHSEDCNDDWAGGHYYNTYEKLTRYDLASKYYLYVDNNAVKVPAIKDWNVITFVQNYNMLWSIFEIMNSPTTFPTKEEKEDIYKLFLLTQEEDKKYEEKIGKLSTLRTLDELKNKFEKRDYDGDKIREKCENCLQKEDKKMTENEKNYFPKNKGKTGVDTQLKSAFYSQEDLDAALEKIGDFLETHTNTAKNKCKESVKKISGFSDEDLDEICTRVVDTFYSASDFSKKTFDEFKSWMKEKYKDYTKEVKEEPKTENVKVNNNQSIVTVNNNDTDTGTHKVSSTDTEQPKPVFKLGDVVYTNGDSVGYISRIGYNDRYCYYYWTPIIISSTDKTLKSYVANKEIGLTYPYQNHYKRIGNYLMSDLNCVKEMARTDSVYKLSEDNFKKFPFLDKYLTDLKDKENSTTTDSLTPPLSKKTGRTDSLPKYLSKLHLTDSAYSYEVNTKLTTDIVSKLNEVIEALDDIILYHLQEKERQNELKGTLPSSEKVNSYSSVYNTIRKNGNISWPSWKKELFNNSCAISTHAKKM